MKLTSPAFINQASIPQKYTCQGEGINPPLEISEVPENAKTLVLIVDDPDAPQGEFVHWVMWHIDPATTVIEENSIPQGAMEGMNSASELGWIAPCPPEDTGEHHYRFMLSALSKDIELEEGTTRDDLYKTMENYVIDRAELVGMYSSIKNHPTNPTELP